MSIANAPATALTGYAGRLVTEMKQRNIALQKRGIPFSLFLAIKRWKFG